MDAHHRALHYVEVFYLKSGHVSGMKFKHYPVEEATKIFNMTVKKLTDENKEALVCLREENHQLITSIRL